MGPTLTLDPALLAIPAVSNSEAKVAAALEELKSIASKLRDGDALKFYMHPDASDYLAKAGHFPAGPAISKLLADLNLAHVYTPEDIRRATVEILSRIESLQSLSRISFMVPTAFAATPDILVQRESHLREALELSLAHLAFVSQKTDPSLAQIIIADHLVEQSLLVVSDVEDIEADNELGLGSSEKVSQIVKSTPSADSVMGSISAETLWAHAETESEAILAIKLAAYKIRRDAGCPSPKDNCDDFCLGKSFLETLQQHQASRTGTHSQATLDHCARIVARLPKEEISRFFKPTGQRNKTQDVTRESDKAEAYRTHVTKRHEGLRLMFWRLPNSSIEFANVGVKAKLEIL